MARGFWSFCGFLCVVLSGSVGFCMKHSEQTGIAEFRGAENDPSEGSAVRTSLQGSLVLIQDRKKRETELEEKIRPAASELKPLRRSKRRWSPLPFRIKENEAPPFPKEVETIGSDSSANHTVFYVISGPGVTEPPIGLFSVDRDTGMIRVHRGVNREDHHQFVFIARVFDRFTEQETDLPLPVTVNVEDVNDNPPKLAGSHIFSVPEHSNPGTRVGGVIANDTDEPGTAHTQIKFTLLNGTELFSIHPVNGIIYTETAMLDREVQDVYILLIQLQDYNGGPEALSTLGLITILITDINDNPPTFRKKLHKAKVRENTKDVLVLRIPVDDKDLEGTPNWNVLYVIKSGNEEGNFKIETDPKTNEGLLYVIKPLDFEVHKLVKLEVMAQNEQPLVGTRASWASVPVDLTVTDEDEGPEFSAPIKTLLVKENVPEGTLIGSYTARDPESQSSEGIKYFKTSDVASWIDVNETSGDLTTLTTLDRESPFVTNGQYNITVEAVDASSKTGTGTVILMIEDVNDNAPAIPTKDLILCDNSDSRSVLVQAEDKDGPPYSAPFSFYLPKDNDGKWRLKDASDTSVVLEQVRDLPTGLYTVPVMVEDLQSFGVLQTVTVQICVCQDGKCPESRSSVALGVWAILAMLLALALLLLLCLCCVLACHKQAGKIYIDDAGTGMLLKSNTEAPGEEVNSSLMLAPTSALNGSLKMGGMGGMDRLATVSTGSMGKQNLEGQDGMSQNMYSTLGGEISAAENQNVFSSARFGAGQFESMKRSSGHFIGTMQSMQTMQTMQSMQTMQTMQSMQSSYSEGAFSKYAEFSLLDTWRTNNLYLKNKTEFFVTEDEGRYADDLPLEYDYEGQGSPAGSVGCCSDQPDEDGLEFLDTLGPKFKTLADICGEK